MAPKYRIFLLFVISLIVTYFVYWPILKIAKEKGIVDNPDARKLQRVPVPVLGGVAVFFGIVVGLSFFKTMLSYTCLFAVLTAMIAMLYLGTIDDILNLSPYLRLAVEVIVMALLIYGTHFTICNFQGLWGIDFLPKIISVLLSIVAMVGIINAINMIDGVDGMVSGFCIVAFTLFGVIFFCEHEYSFAALAAVSVGALIPFFVHNVFGRGTKMYIGDGGTMMVGTILASMVIALCKYRVEYENFITSKFSVIAFSLAVLAVPVFDTLRVMTYRISKGKSPFHPDKNHMHHIFIELGFSHIGTTMSEIVMNLFVVAVWILTWNLGASVAVQFYCVIGASLLVTFGAAAFLKRQIGRNTPVSSFIKGVGEATHIEKTQFWKRVQSLVDRNRSTDAPALAIALMVAAAAMTSCGSVEMGEPDTPDVNELNAGYLQSNNSCIAVFGDIQQYTQEESLSSFYINSLQWLKERQSALGDISCIIQTGDITNNNEGHQWRRFRKCTETVSAEIPFYTSTGNHDYSCDAQQRIYDRRSTYLMNYYDFELPFEMAEELFEDHRLDNAVYRNYFNGERVDVMVLEFSPRPEVVEWAKDYLEKHSDVKHIVVVHELLGRGGVIIEDNNYADKCFKSTGLPACKPSEVWDNVIFPHENVLCAICGHVSEFIIYAEMTNAAGRHVPVIMFNLESLPNGGDGWIMLLNAGPEDDSVSISVYNTVRDEYYNGSKVFNSFKIR